MNLVHACVLFLVPQITTGANLKRCQANYDEDGSKITFICPYSDSITFYRLEYNDQVQCRFMYNHDERSLEKSGACLEPITGEIDGMNFKIEARIKKPSKRFY